MARPASSSSSRFYDEAAARLETESDLRAAIEGGQIEPHFQTIVDLVTGRIVGVEGLARWTHPDRGLLLPDQFVPVDERCGLIVPLGWQVLEQSCRRARAWQQRHREQSPLSVSVNLSVNQLAAPDCVARVAETLQRTTSVVQSPRTWSAESGASDSCGGGD